MFDLQRRKLLYRCPDYLLSSSITCNHPHDHLYHIHLDLICAITSWGSDLRFFLPSFETRVSICNVCFYVLRMVKLLLVLYHNFSTACSKVCVFLSETDICGEYCFLSWSPFKETQVS